MNKDQLHELILDYLDSKLDPRKKKVLDLELESLGYDLNNLEELQDLVKAMDEVETPMPSQKMNDRFYKMLEEEMNESEQKAIGQIILKGIDSFFSNFLSSKLSYGLIMLLLGWIIGFWITPSPKISNQMSQMNEEIMQMKELVMINLLDQPMASERLKAMNMITASSDNNNQIIKSLLHTLNNDSDVNVRMAAVEALLAFANQNPVREGLKNAVNNQNSPLVQLTLVDGLVAIKDKTAVPIFENLIASNNIHQAVKKRSREGINKLI
jgi:hypothetical protein